MADYGRVLGSKVYDGLVSDTNPAVKVAPATIRKLSTAGTFKRGTIFAKSSGTAGDGKLVLLGETAASNETLTAYCILAEDTAVGTSLDVNAAVYVCGCFDIAKCTVKSGYTITEGDKDALRDGGVFFKSAQA